MRRVSGSRKGVMSTGESMSNKRGEEGCGALSRQQGRSPVAGPCKVIQILKVTDHHAKRF